MGQSQSLLHNSHLDFSLCFVDSSQTIASKKLKQWNRGLWKFLHSKETPDSLRFWTYTQKLLQHAAKNGYPFAALKLDTIHAAQGCLTVVWQFSLNELFLNGKLRVPDPAAVRPKVLAKALGLESGKSFEWLSLADFKSRLAQLSFISLSDTPLVFFEDKQAIWQLPIQAEKGTQAEGILGFQSDDKSVRLTGELLLDFKNSFRNTDQIRLHYRSFPGGSQQFELLTSIPLIAGTAWGGQVSVTLFRRDSTFLELEPELRALFKTGVYSELQLFYSSRQTFPILTALAGFSNIAIETWGLGFGINHLDNPALPIRGWKLKAEASAGNRTQDEVIQSAYRYTLEAQWHVPVYKRLTHSVSIVLNGLESPRLLTADYFRTGGVNSLRGFDEASLLSSRWLLISLEPRFFLDRSTFILTSIQWAQGLRKNEIFQARSLGIGLGLKSKVGQFQLVYAAGSLIPDPLKFSLAKVHLGYRLLF